MSTASKAGLNLVWPVPCFSSNGLNRGGQPSLGSRHIQSTTPPSTKLGRSLRLLWAPVCLFSLRSVGGVSVTMAEWTPSNTRERVWVPLQGIPAWPPTSIARVETRRVFSGARVETRKVFSRGARPTFTPDHTEGGEPALSQTQEDRRTERLSACPAVVLGSCVGDTLWELAGPPCLGHLLHQTGGVTLKMEGGREHAWCVLSGPCLSLRPRGLQPARLRCPWDSPGRNTGVGCRCLLQGIFPTQGSHPGLLRCKRAVYH